MSVKRMFRQQLIIKALGNAVVPAQVLPILRSIGEQNDE